MAEKERVYRLGLADPRTGAERFMGLLSKAVSPVGYQNRKWDDDPQVVRNNLVEQERVLQQKKNKRKY